MTIELNEDVYMEVLSAWLTDPGVLKVAEATGYPRGVVSKLAKEGVPSLGLAPLPPPPKNTGTSVHKRKRKQGTKSQDDESAPKSGRSLQARVVIAKDEAAQRVAALKEKLAGLEDEAKALGLEADFEEARQGIDGTALEIDVAERRVEVEEARIENVGERAIVADNIERSANEAAVAREGMRIVLNMAAITGHVTDRILQGIEMGNIELPEQVDGRMLQSMTSAAVNLTTAMERAIKIEKGRAGEPDMNLGVQIGILLDGCSDEELEEVQARGAVPSRLRLVGGDG